MREYSCSRNSARSSSSVASARIATMSGRGVITSRTSVSPKSTIDCSSRRSSPSIRPGPRPLPSASRGSRRIGGSRRHCSTGAIGPLAPALRGNEPHQRPVSGCRNRATTSNGGSSTSSTRSGLRRTISSGSTCSQTRMKTATKSEQHADRLKPGAPGQDRDEHRRQREDDAEQQPRRNEQLDRVVEIEPEAIVAAAAFRHQPQREAHQGAERGLDVPT